ncbi:hypothetical protein J4441_02875 [Candidatus Micrarchaeota archaeon]|nr:hypothetical protein [Candidatus Micrarchaeota archaeon]
MALEQTAKKIAVWAIAFLFVLQVSGCIAIYAFMEKFFDAQAYDASLEKRGVYATIQESLSGMLTSQIPQEYKGEINAELSAALTKEYVRGQVKPMVANTLSYLSGASPSMRLYFDFSPIAQALSASQSENARSLAPQIQQLNPVINSQLQQISDTLASDPQVAQMRGAFSAANAANAALFVLALVELALIFLLSGDYRSGIENRSGIEKCAGAVFSAGAWGAIGGLMTAFLTGSLVASMIGSMVQADASGGASEVASIMAGMMGDIFYETGMLALLLSLPLLLVGGGVLAYFKFVLKEQAKP